MSNKPELQFNDATRQYLKDNDCEVNETPNRSSIFIINFCIIAVLLALPPIYFYYGFDMVENAVHLLAVVGIIVSIVSIITIFLAGLVTAAQEACPDETTIKHRNNAAKLFWESYFRRGSKFYNPNGSLATYVIVFLSTAIFGFVWSSIAITVGLLGMTVMAEKPKLSAENLQNELSSASTSNSIESECVTES